MLYEARRGRGWLKHIEMMILTESMCNFLVLEFGSLWFL